LRFIGVKASPATRSVVHSWRLGGLIHAAEEATEARRGSGGVPRAARRGIGHFDRNDLIVAADDAPLTEASEQTTMKATIPRTFVRSRRRPGKPLA